MSRSLVRRGLAAATVVTMAALATAAGSTSAYASHGGSGDLLSSGGGDAITFSDGRVMPLPPSPSADIAWSPDGSRVAFIDAGGAVVSYRYGSAGFDGTDSSRPIDLVEARPGGFRNHPTWSADGSTIFYSERVSNTSQWTINFSSSAPGGGDFQLTPNDGFDYFLPDAGPTGVLVAERQDDDGHGDPLGNPMVVTINEATGAATPIVAGQDPAVSPDGKRVAFVGANIGVPQIWTSDLSGGDLVQVTGNAAGDSSPTWSPDGEMIAFKTDGGVATVPADGSDPGNPTMVSHVFGLPAYVPQIKDHVVELAGRDRFATAIAISQSHWATAGASGDNREPAQSVTLSRSDTFADAISGSALAAAKHGPLLLTPPTTFNAGTKTEIQRVLGTDRTKTVYILGDTSAISASTETAIKNIGYQTKRLAGADRYATSVAIARAISPAPEIVLTATGLNFPDALGAGAAAGSFDANSPLGAVVVLTNDTRMPAVTESYLENWDATVPADNRLLGAVGDQADAALTGAGWSQYLVAAGKNRYDTAQTVAIDFFGGELSAGVTTGLNWPDALAGGALLGTINGPLLLTPGSSTLIPATSSLLDSSSGSISVGYVFGDTLPLAINAQIGAAISGPGGFDSAQPTTVAQATKVAKANHVATISQIEARAHMSGAATISK